MGDLEKLSPELENTISSLEILDISLVSSPEGREYMVDVIKDAKSAKSMIIGFFAKSKKLTYEAWKSVCADEKLGTDRCDAIETNGKRAILKYDNEQAAERRKEQMRLQAAEDARAARERERLEKRAETLKTPELKEAALAEAESIIAPVVQIGEQAKSEGVSTRKTWKARVVDISLVPRAYMVVNQQALDALAKATKGSMALPGVEFYEDSSLTVKF